MASRIATFGIPLWLLAACFPEESEHPLREPRAPGGATSGGATSGGATSGGALANTGGTTGGGDSPVTTGGRTTGGAASGGAATTGGKATGGAATGGKASGGATTGGKASGGAATGGVPENTDSSCAGKDYLICEDFESTPVGDVPEGWMRHGDLAGVSDDAAKAGRHSLKLRPANNSERRIYHPAGLLGSAHWGRIHYKVLTPVPDAFVHSTLVSFTGDAPTRGPSEFRTVDTVKQAVDTRDVGSKHQYLYNVQVTGSSEFGREGPYDQEFENVWRCVEYHIDASNQSFALYVDGEEELSFENGAGKYDRSEIPDEFDQLRVGWVNYQSAPPGFTAWIDEIAFDDERLGCD